MPESVQNRLLTGTLQCGIEWKQVEAFFFLIFAYYPHLDRLAENHLVIFYDTLGKPFDLHPSLKKLKIPTLILHGDKDPIPVSIAKRLHESIEDSRYVVLENCGHFPYVEKPDEHFKVLDEFLMK